MAFRRLVADVKTWTLRELACAAGVVAVSAGAGYCIHRSLRGGSAPPEHTQPSHEPEDVLEDTPDTPSVLQVVELNLQLLPTEPRSEPSAVVLDMVDVQPASEAPAVVLPLDDGELISAWRDVQFLSVDVCRSQSETVLVKTYFLSMIRGPESRLCWFKTTETHYYDHEGFPYHTVTEDSFTAIQGAFGRVTEFISCNCEEASVSMTLYDHLHQTFTKVTCTYLRVGADDQVDTATWVQKNIEDSPCSESESQPDFEESFTPEEMEVPFISCHLADRGVTGIGLKLCALRQAFSTLLASIHNQNVLFVVGKKIVMQLAAANNQNPVGVQLAYESLIQFLRRPSNQDWIEAELSGVEIHHYNFLDVFFEMLVFGRFTNSSAPEPFEGGFLERLFALISMWDVEEWEPEAGIYFTVLIDHLTALCEVLFSQPVELYDDPAALASTVMCLLRQHIQLMMDSLESL